MTEHRIGTHEEWRKERIALLEAEKEHTRRGDELATQRRELPWVPVDKDYAFATADGPASLADLFAGNSQLVVYHMMNPGCPACACVIDGLDGIAPHLQGHDVAVATICRFPLEDVLAFGKRQGWTLPLVSSEGSDFNRDLEVLYTAEEVRAGAEHNFQELPRELAEMMPVVDAQGLSSFAREGDQVFHTYSGYSRATDVLNLALQWLDRAPLGRNQGGEPWPLLRPDYAHVH
ncbi:DUF899 domain-containing protein [Actinomycetospora atypica]|uniref:DUF899 domain-containing protein n=1 Tax=Actinomycetospora atypica TaxID=1290095 RepID=A0ABV9YMZ0_9PSEU